MQLRKWRDGRLKLELGSACHAESGQLGHGSLSVSPGGHDDSAWPADVPPIWNLDTYDVVVFLRYSSSSTISEV